jgi:hypothetical protein
MSPGAGQKRSANPKKLYGRNNINFYSQRSRLLPIQLPALPLINNLRTPEKQSQKVGSERERERERVSEGVGEGVGEGDLPGT